MKKVTAVSEDSIIVKIGRFNESTKEATIGKDGTVGDALEFLDIDLNSEETLWLEGVKADMDDVLENGDRVVIVPKKDGGDGEEAPTPTEEVEPKTGEDKEEAPTPEKE